jgi:uncharacterized protein (TIGR03435 family)
MIERWFKPAAIAPAIVCLLIIACMLAFGQNRLEFEVASIRPASAQIQQVNVGLHIDGAQVRGTSLALRDYIVLAYRLKPDQIAGPDWITSERFDIAAKLPDGAAQDQFRDMLQTLLIDRFHMKTHHETKELPVYILGVAKSGLKMAELPPDPDAGDAGHTPVNISGAGRGGSATINLGAGSFFTLGPHGFEVKKLTMETFADMLTRFTDRPVVDMTDLKGRYDFMLELSPEDRTATMVRAALTAGVVLPPQALAMLDNGSNASLISALQKLGLTFEARKAPLDVLVIDSIQKTPTEN